MYKHSINEKSLCRSVQTVTFASSFLTPFMVSSVNIALPTIGNDLSMSAVSLSWVTTAYLLCSTIFLIPFGKIADTYGRKKVFTAGISVTTISSLLSAAATDGTLLIATRMLHGAGAAMAFGTGIAMLTSVFPAENRGRILGFNVSFTYLGLSVGPVLGGIITRHLGWRWLFIINIPIGLAVMTILLAGVKQEWKEQTGGGFDPAGMILYGASIASIVIGFSSLSTPSGMALTALSVAIVTAFIRHESRASRPILPIALFSRNRLFAFSNMAALINYSATYAIGFLMSLYLQYVKGLPPDKAGALMIVQPLVMVLLSPAAGRLSDLIEPRIPASSGMGCITIGLLLLAKIDGATPMPFIILAMLLFGSGFALFSSPNTSAVLGSVDKSKYGIASATVGTMRLLGQVLSMGFTMLLVSVMIGPAKLSPDSCHQFLRMMHATSHVFAVMSAAGVAVSLVRGNMPPKQGNTISRPTASVD